jgi:hypothetical protein
MATLKQRVTELEAKTPQGGETEPLFLYFVGVGSTEPMKRIARDSREWWAQPGETDDAFMARVNLEDGDRPAKPGGRKVFLCR